MTTADVARWPDNLHADAAAERPAPPPASGISITDMVNHPPHYKASGIEAIDVIEAFDLDFHCGNALKYILRAGRKGDELEDMRKARWYLDRAIEKLARAQEPEAPEYDGQKDFAGSLNVGYEAIHERVAKGGSGWEHGGWPVSSADQQESPRADHQRERVA